jgi:hypothetical protein
MQASHWAVSDEHRAAARRSGVALSRVVVLAFCAVACASSPRQSPQPAAPRATVEGRGGAVVDSSRLDSVIVIPDVSAFTRTSSGVLVFDATAGNGAVATEAKDVEVSYTGMLENRFVFDSSRRRGSTLRFTIGEGKVIRGLEVGVTGMRVGGRRILMVPPELAYGPAGLPPDIPGNARLIFEVTLVGVKQHLQLR